MFKIDLTKTVGKIKPLHGINNGPISYGNLTDLRTQYKNAGIPIVRLHDTDWPGPYQVDIPKIFPNFDADANDPASYRFAQTDEIISAIFEVGAEPIYRLGVSIEHIKERIYARKPSDFQKWADICVHVIRHYNEGWANGGHYGIRFWEIWNEPDGGANMWTDGTAEDYYEMYCVASKAIRAACPDVFVGGYAATSVNKEEFVKGFFEKIRAEGAPLDFFSYHKYSQGSNCREYVDDAAKAREYVVNYGYPNALIICDEWNYVVDQTAWDSLSPLSQNTPMMERRRCYQAMKDMPGASFCAATMTCMQNSEVDIAAYYDGQPHMLWCGLFDAFGVEQKTFYAFQAFDKLYRLGEQLKVTGNVENCYALAAKKEDRAFVLLTNHNGADCDLEVSFAGESAQKVTVYLLDDSHDLEKDRVEHIAAKDFEMHVCLAHNSIVLLELEAEKENKE